MQITGDTDDDGVVSAALRAARTSLFRTVGSSAPGTRPMHNTPDNDRRSARKPTAPESVPSAGWRETYETYGIDPSIEPADKCEYPAYNEADDVELCIILGADDPEIRVTCPDHWNDTLEVTT